MQWKLMHRVLHEHAMIYRQKGVDLGEGNFTGETCKSAEKFVCRIYIS